MSQSFGSYRKYWMIITTLLLSGRDSENQGCSTKEWNKKQLSCRTFSSLESQGVRAADLFSISSFFIRTHTLRIQCAIHFDEIDRFSHIGYTESELEERVG
ncbi:hypothetical protein Droror1_Dr00028077 [Drosera rotundifolia]